MLEKIQKKITSKVDPLGWAPAVVAVAGRAVRNPQDVAAASTTYASRLVQIPAAAVRVFQEPETDPPVPVDPRDKRFADASWRENPAFFALQQGYLATCDLVDDLAQAGAGNPLQDGKAYQIAHLLLDAFAPTNFPLTNPGVLIRAFETGGASLFRGVKFAAHDLVHRGGSPVKVDRDAFTLGEDLAATPGKVIFRNDLIEVIQYEPQTEQVHAIPILVAPPWINKYYILDLSPSRSLVEWAVQHGRTVFAISYRNPDSSMMDVTMDNYYTQGISAAMDVVENVTGS